MLFSHRVFQNTSLPLKNARCTPAARAASTLVRCAPDQYSSWPTERKTLCSQDLGAAAIGVDAGRVADVVAVGLEPAHHRVLGVEHPVLGRRAAGRERPVVADLVGAAGIVAGPPTYRLLPPYWLYACQVVSDVWNSRSEWLVVVAHDEHDVAGAAGVDARSTFAK